MGVIRNVFKNGVAVVFSRVVRALEHLLLVPFFLSSWGAEYYGEWLTLTIIPSVLAFSDLGFGAAIGNSFVLSYASGDKQKSVDILKSGFFLNTCSVILGILVTLAVLLLGDQFDLFSKSYIEANEAIWAVAILMASRLFGFFNQMFDGLYRAARRAYLSTAFQSLHIVINIVVGVVVLCLGGGVVQYASSQFVVSIIFTILFGLIGIKGVSFDGCVGTIKRADLKFLSWKGLGYMISPIWQSIYFQGSTFVVRILLGPTSVAVFNTVRSVVRSVNQLLSVFNGTFFPELQYEYGRGNFEMVRRLFRVSVLMSFVFGLLGCLCLLFFGLSLYEFWTNNCLTVDKSIWYVFMIGIVFNAVWWTSVIVYRAVNRPYRFAIASLIISLVSVGLSYLLGERFGLLGVVVGYVVFDFLMSLFVFRDTCRILTIRSSELFSGFSEDLSLIRQKMLSKK